MRMQAHAAAWLVLTAPLAAAAEPIQPFVGAHAVPVERPFEPKAGSVDFEIPFTETWYADYYAARWTGKPLADPAQIQADLAPLKIPVRVFFPSDFDPKRRYPLFVANFTECKDSRDAAGSYSGEGHAAGYVTAGFWMVDGFQKAKWFKYGSLPAAVCVYVASTVARYAPIDPNRIYVGGHSGGAKISTWYYSAYPADYAGLMVLGCNQFSPVDRSKDVMIAAQARSAAVFCGTGKRDDIAPPASSLGVFREFEAMKIPFLLNWDHEEGHAVPAAQQQKAFAFFNASYADHYKKAEAAALRTGVTLAKAKRYGAALFPLMKVASFKPDSDKAKEAATHLETIDKDIADTLAESEKLLGEKKTYEAKTALQKAAKRFEGSWYAFEFRERARRVGKQ